MKEKKLKNMAAGSELSHGSNREDMENVIKGVGLIQSQNDFFHDTYYIS
jgi:hypothetical protein